MSSVDFRNALQRRDGCPLCKCADSAVHYGFKDIPVLRCAGCGFLYSGFVLPGGALQSFYADTYGGSRHMQGQEVNARINLVALRRLLPLHEVKSFLDVGSGFGFLLKSLQDEYGISTTGVELSRDEAEHASKLGVRTYSSPLTEIPLPRESFDVVACFEVIEHVPYPLGFIDEMLQFVKPGGALIIMTDNFESPAARHLGCRFPKWIPHQHISHFSSRTLRHAVGRSSSVEIERELSYTPWELQVKRLVKAGSDAGDAARVYDLERELHTEMARSYRLFWLRRHLNRMWARLSFRGDLEGALMYVVARKTARRGHELSVAA